VVKNPHAGSTGSNASPKHTQPGGKGSGQGLSAAEVKGRLAGKIGTTGVAGGTGFGKPGDPNGNPNADPYNALIKITLERAWNKPSIPENLQTYIKIRVKPDGRIQFEGLEKSSGNTEMDNSVIEAVHKVPRMPQPPPAGLGNPDYVVTINFKLH
jgi:TonB family protein